MKLKCESRTIGSLHIKVNELKEKCDGKDEGESVYIYRHCSPLLPHTYNSVLQQLNSQFRRTNKRLEVFGSILKCLMKKKLRMSH